MKNKIKLLYSALIMFFGIVILKFLPMSLFGENIVYDASLHVVIAGFILYFVYVFIEDRKKLRIPYCFFSAIVLIIVAVQRLLVNAHNDIGIILGLIILVAGIVIPRYKEVFKK